jgi:hypothetical protein
MSGRPSDHVFNEIKQGTVIILRSSSPRFQRVPSYTKIGFRINPPHDVISLLRYSDEELSLPHQLVKTEVLQPSDALVPINIR